MKDLIQRKLDQYNSQTEEDEESALKEITQEIVLYALSKTDYFKKASFQGGTCLRIVYGLDRFSEDLDFVLNSPTPGFDIEPYLKKTSELVKVFGYQMEIAGKDKTANNVKKRFLKDKSIKKLITFKHLSDLNKKINIKVELDVNPPEGAESEVKFLDFPADYAISVHDLRCLFAGKLHALLCRSFTKGRDWYDFGWYVSQKISPNYTLLKNALFQQGPWKGKTLSLDRAWVIKELNGKIQQIDWQAAIRDISPFLKSEKNKEVSQLWSEKFFQSKLERIL